MLPYFIIFSIFNATRISYTYRPWVRNTSHNCCCSQITYAIIHVPKRTFFLWANPEIFNSFVCIPCNRKDTEAQMDTTTSNYIDSLRKFGDVWCIWTPLAN